jgi:hypothetical protein
MPAAGVVARPILARALGSEVRGELAVALAADLHPGPDGCKRNRSLEPPESPQYGPRRHTGSQRVGVFVILVPAFGVTGACWTSIISNVTLTSLMVLVASRLMNKPAQDFLLVRAIDVALVWREGARLVERGLARVLPANAGSETSRRFACPWAP